MATNIHVPQSLRPYQREALDAIKAAWDEGKKALIAVATGGGKTTIGAQLLHETIDPYRQRALVIGHTKEIVEQFYRRVENQFAGKLSQPYQVPGALMAPGLGMVMAENDEADARIIVATRQTVQNEKRLKRLMQTGHFDVVLIDEAHHALADNTYGKIVKALQEVNPFVKIAGLTATPKRTDRKALGTVFDEIVYQWLIPDGINGGYLVPVQRVKVSTRVSLSGVRTSRGDYSQTALANVLEAHNWRDLALEAYNEHILKTGRKTLAFFPNLAMSKEFADVLNGQGVRAAHVDGNTPKPERTDILKRYTSGELDVVTNMGVLTEGFDAPATGAVLLARPTRSKTLFTQIVGRGLRLYPGKDNCLLLDLTVVDTKALEMGTLFGRLVKCHNCDCEYTAGLKACPKCGAPPLPPEKGEPIGSRVITTKYDGEGLSVEFVSLFENAFAAWHMGDDGLMSVGLGYDNGTMIIMPPLVDEYYRLGHVPKDPNSQIKLLNMNEDLGSLMETAETAIKKHGKGHTRTAQKDAQWRADPPTSGQRRMLKRLGLDVPEGLTKGSASQLITHAMYAGRAINEPWSVG